MGLTADNLVEVLATCADGELDGLTDDVGEIYGVSDIVAILRQGQPSFAPTLLAAWEAEGRELSPALRYDLDAARARVAYYRTVDARLRAKVTGLTSVKGLEIIDLYPAGLARHMNDLDFVASTESGLWQACAHLVADGWQLHTASFSYFGGCTQVMLSVRRLHEDPYQLPYAVELTTYYSIGNYGAVWPLVRLPGEWQAPAIKNIIMLLYERFEQPFRARDLVDTALLHSALRGDELSELHHAVVTLNLGIEYGELLERTDRAGLGPLPAWPAKRLATATIRARRMARGASFYLRPVAATGMHLQRHMILGRMNHAEAIAWETVQRRLSVPKALSGGLMAFGLPMDGPPPQVTRTVLYRDGKLTWADTPMARFLLAIGDFVSQGEIDNLASHNAEPAHSIELAAEPPRWRPSAAVNVPANHRV
jgi:hypothetical protein